MLRCNSSGPPRRARLPSLSWLTSERSERPGHARMTVGAFLPSVRYAPATLLLYKDLVGGCCVHTIKSVNNVLIRLSSERWEHISQNHPECAGYLYDILNSVQRPNSIYSGKHGECIAVKEFENSDKLLAVVYREVDKKDGFIITAFITKRLKWLEKRRKIWP